MRLDHRTTNGIHALKLIRPSTEPSIRIGVIAAKTNWKYASDDCGKLKAGPVVIDGITACPCSAACPRIVAGLPHMFAKKLPPLAPKMCIGSPKPILNAYSTQTLSTSANATKVSIIEFTHQRFCLTPP